MKNIEAKKMEMNIDLAEVVSGIGGLTQSELINRLEGLFWKGYNTALARHPDSVRLDHLITCDHSTLAPLDDDNPQTGTIESLNFIFENPLGSPGSLSSPAQVRSAIDRSITNRAARNCLIAARDAS
jgi:hypothetical protein